MLAGWSRTKIATVVGFLAFAGAAGLWLQYNGAPPGPSWSSVSAARTVAQQKLRSAAGGSGNLTAPREGRWVAIGTTLNSEGFREAEAGEPIVRRMEITRQCPGDRPCGLWLVRETRSEPPWEGPLVRHGNAWYVTFPARHFPCQTNYWARWRQETTMVFFFTSGGTRASGGERKYSYSPQCGDGAKLMAWSAKWVGPGTGAYVKPFGAES